MEKEKLIKAINSKGLHNSLISIYYNIGRALPFRAQRFPDGRVSEWYKSQFEEVHIVKPGGKNGKYGTAYGFHYRDGKRENCYDDNEHIDITIPQEIPCGACGSWVLLDILGEPTVEPTKIYGLNDVLDFGKYKGKTLLEIISTDWKWVKWAIEQSDLFFCDIEAVEKEKNKHLKVLHSNDIIDFGKYKGKTLHEIQSVDPNYILWLKKNAEDFTIDL